MKEGDWQEKREEHRAMPKPTAQKSKTNAPREKVFLVQIHHSYGKWIAGCIRAETRADAYALLLEMLKSMGIYETLWECKPEFFLKTRNVLIQVSEETPPVEYNTEHLKFMLAQPLA